MTIDATDRRIINATQSGLPLAPAPYAVVAGWLGLSEGEVIDRMAAMQEKGVIRRIAIAPNHYALGVTANGMSVWDVVDDHAEALGAKVGALDFVSHCYLRPRALPDWPYNLFAMIHGHDRAEVEAKRQEVAALLGDACGGSDILYSTRILKKTGLRLREGADVPAFAIYAGTGQPDPGAPPLRPGETGGDLEPDAALQPQVPALLHDLGGCAFSRRIVPRTGDGGAG